MMSKGGISGSAAIDATVSNTPIQIEGAPFAAQFPRHGAGCRAIMVVDPMCQLETAAGSGAQLVLQKCPLTRIDRGPHALNKHEKHISIVRYDRFRCEFRLLQRALEGRRHARIVAFRRVVEKDERIDGEEGWDVHAVAGGAERCDHGHRLRVDRRLAARTLRHHRAVGHACPLGCPLYRRTRHHCVAHPPPERRAHSMAFSQSSSPFRC